MLLSYDLQRQTAELSANSSPRLDESKCFHLQYKAVREEFLDFRDAAVST
jgi:hypothetical protein